MRMRITLFPTDSVWYFITPGRMAASSPHSIANHCWCLAIPQLRPNPTDHTTVTIPPPTMASPPIPKQTSQKGTRSTNRISAPIVT